MINKNEHPQELVELNEWFDQCRLPESLQLDQAVYIPDLPDTVLRLFEQAEVCYDNPKMQGCICLLERIREKLGETVG